MSFQTCKTFVHPNLNILICVLKMNEGLEWHEGEQLMTEFSFLGELSF